MKKESLRSKIGSKFNRLADSHPVLHAIILMAFYMLLTAVFTLFVILVCNLTAAVIYVMRNGGIGDSSHASTELLTTISTIAAYLLFVLVYWFRHRTQLHRFFRVSKTGWGILLGWSVLVTTCITFSLNRINHEPIGNPGAALLMGLQPGITEEIMFRIVPISIAMKSSKRRQLVLPVFLFTGLCFGLVHSMNIFAGANPILTLIQVIYAVGVGFLFAAIYMRTGNMWITILLHTFNDAMDFLSPSLQSSGGVLTDTPDAGGLIVLLLFAALYYINAFLLFRKSSQEAIPDTWAEIWGGHAE